LEGVRQEIYASVIGREIEGIVQHILELRTKGDDKEAVEFGDMLFESLTPAMNILWLEGRFNDLTDLWLWSISVVKGIEDKSRTVEGQGVHKGTAFYFLAVSRLLASDFDSAFMWFAEAAKEDECLPQEMVTQHSGSMPPAVKMMLLDPAADNFAQNIVSKSSRL